MQDEPELFDYVKFLKLYSSIIYDLFIYSLHYAKKQSDCFTINDFSDSIKLLAQVDISSQGQNALKKLKIAIENKIATLEKISDQQINQFKEELHRFGITPENTYLFIKGHILYENVVCMFLQPIALYLKSKQFKQISELKKDDEEATNRRNQYKKDFIDIELVLRNNTNYYDCFLMKKILTDIEKYKKINFGNN